MPEVCEPSGPATRTRDRVLRAHLDRLLGLDGHARVGTSGVEAALTDCPNELWQTDLWPDEAPTGSEAERGIARLGSLVPRLPRADYARL